MPQGMKIVAKPDGTTTIQHPASTVPPHAPPKAPASAGKAAAPSAAPAAVPGGGFMSAAQLGALANRTVAQNTQASLIPLRQQSGAIQGTESTVANRLAGYNQIGDQVMQGLQGNAATSALTADNQAAQLAQNSANAIDKTGAAAKALNANYLDPAVAAQLANQSTQAGTNAGANAQFASTQGANESNLMSNLRASAASRAIEGEQNVASLYGAQLGTNRAAQQTLLAKEPATAKALASTLGQQDFTDRATLLGLGIKSKAQQDAFLLGTQKNQTSAYQAATQRLGVSSLANYRIASLSVTAQNDYAKQQESAANTALASGRLSAQEKQWQTQNAINWAKVNTTSNPAAKAQATDMAQVAGIRHEYENALNPASYSAGKTPLTPQAALTALEAKFAKSGALVPAAVELARYGVITPGTAKALQAQGVQIPSNWLAKPVPPGPLPSNPVGASSSGKFKIGG
jgi:hypothetical protein